jgi:hypothetical protein
LQETLVHYEINPADLTQYEHEILISEREKIGVNLRPFLVEALTEISKNYFIIVISSSTKPISDLVLNLFDPLNKLIKLRLYEENCVRTILNKEFVNIKDIRILSVPLTKVVIIDNSVLSFAFQIKNGIPILPFYNSKTDNELKILVSYLTHLSQFEDLQEENGTVFGFEKLLENQENILSSDLDDLIIDSDKDSHRVKSMKREKIEPIKRSHLNLNFVKNNFNSNSSYESNSLLSCLILLNKGPLNYDSVYNTNNIQVSFDCSGGDSEVERVERRKNEK